MGGHENNIRKTKKKKKKLITKANYSIGNGSTDMKSTAKTRKQQDGYYNNP